MPSICTSKLPNKPQASDYANEVQADISLKLPAGRYQAEWVNTKNGTIDKSDRFDHNGGDRKIASPTFIVDVALRIRKQP